jgi:hypothetical protein
MIREDCFWHHKDGPSHYCKIAEPWTCPCDNCEWFISEADAKEIVRENMRSIRFGK